MRGKSATCIRYLLFSFNVAFWLAGACAVAIGIWMLFDPGRFDDYLGKYSFVIPASILIGAGLFVFFVGFCGCAGAFQENKCLLGTYFTMLVLIFCVEIAAGVLAFLFRHKIKDEITKESQEVVQTKFGTGDPKIDHAVNLVQQELKCCGAKSGDDYDTSRWKDNQLATKTVPESCCSEPSKCTKVTQPRYVYQNGCIDELVEYTKENLMILGGIGIGLACIQLFGMCFACCLFFSIED